MNENTIKKSLLALLLISVLLASPALAQFQTEDISETTVSAARGNTLLMGTIINPVKEDDMYTAQAFQVFFYEPGVFFNNGGIVKRLTTIRFSDDPFLQVWTPGPFEIFGYVFGITSNFEIIEE